MRGRDFGRAVVGLGLVLLWAGIGFAQGQSVTKVKDIRRNPKTYANEVVVIEGFATQLSEASATTTRFYFLKDDWGDVIKVRTTKEYPVVGDRYRVTGPVGIDPTNHNDVYVSEEMRIHVRGTGEGNGEAIAAPEPAPVDVAEPSTAEATIPETVEAGGLSQQTLILIGAIVFVLFLLVILVVWMMRSKQTASADDLGSDTFTPTPTPASPEAMPEPQVVEGHTIKMAAPPPGTLKILPGRLEVKAGDDVVKEIRFYRVKGQSTPELTFGRAAGAPYTHIQLKPMTVSSRQAKLTFINNQWVLTNFAPDTSNPTRHNGVELPVDGQTALAEGDTIEMGEVALIYHES